MPSFKGRLTMNSVEIRKILAAEIEHRSGIKVDPDKIWLGLERANEPTVHAHIDLDEAQFYLR